MAIVVTDKAQRELKSLFDQPGKFLRIEVVPGGCAGLTYNAGIDSALGEHDVTLFDSDGLKIVADMRSAMYLGGLEIDYSDDLVKSGFRFINTKAVKSCGCGASFQN